MGQRMSVGFAWLFGASYDDMLSHWNEVGGPFKDEPQQTPRSTSRPSDPDADLPWPNSTLLVRRRPRRGGGTARADPAATS